VKRPNEFCSWELERLRSRESAVFLSEFNVPSFGIIKRFEYLIAMDEQASLERGIFTG
jgi:hypothetical protein